MQQLNPILLCCRLCSPTYLILVILCCCCGEHLEVDARMALTSVVVVVSCFEESGCGGNTVQVVDVSSDLFRRLDSQIYYSKPNVVVALLTLKNENYAGGRGLF